MRCISPITVRNSGKINIVPCGKCNFCLQARRADWSFRLAVEDKKSILSHFLTFTYEDEHIPINQVSGLPEVRKDELQLLFKSLRKANAVVMDSPMRYYAVGEYGSLTSRPHYHVIMFNLHEAIAQRLERFWTKGFPYVGAVTHSSIHYVTKYVINAKDDYVGRAPPFALMSRRPGLGRSYVDTHYHWHNSDLRNFTEVNGIKRRIPRYFKEKLFSAPAREYLNNVASSEAVVRYWNEIERLSAFHSDPFLYYDDIVHQSHEKIVKNVKIKSLF